MIFSAFTGDSTKIFFCPALQKVAAVFFEGAYQEFSPVRNYGWLRKFAAMALILSIGATSINAAEGSSAAGTREFAYVGLFTPARPMGLGEAYTALASGVDAVGFNPAGLMKTEGLFSAKPTQAEIAATLRYHTLDITSGQVGYAFGGSGGRLAFGLAYVNYGDIALRNEEGNDVGSANPSSFNPSISFARAWGEKWKLGGTVKGFQEYLGDFEGSQSAIGYAIDAGFLYQPGVRNLGFGAALLNLGRKHTAHTSDGSNGGVTPVAVKGGMYYIPREIPKAKIVAEMEWRDLENPIVMGALEWALAPSFLLRAGARASALEVKQTWREVVEDASNPRYGGEAKRASGGFTFAHNGFAVDYAVQWWTDLGFVHGLTLRRGLGG